MKKFKKLLAGLLTGAMLLGSMSVSAFAEDTAAPKTPVFDTTKTTGSITIHKYEHDEAGKVDPATGKERCSHRFRAGAELPRKMWDLLFTRLQMQLNLLTITVQLQTDLPAVVSDYVAQEVDKIIDQLKTRRWVYTIWRRGNN